jgi:uracil-DNA glycosylase family 4
MALKQCFDLDCRRCERLAGFLDEVSEKYPGYHARPVAPFGDDEPRLLIVGLAPGLHGANATGRPFTGDYAGILLYETLHRFGYASAPESVGKDDGLQLSECRITNAVKCLPPQNKPLTAEIHACNPYLAAELKALPAGVVILALGTIAHQSVLRALGLRLSQYKFAHAAEHDVGHGLTLVDSYHCSRYNTQTKRLTTAMFRQVFEQIAALNGSQVSA